MQAFEPDLTKWDAWRPEEVAQRLAGVETPWYVAAGWAIDLFLGGERREHDDLEIAVPRERLGEVLESFPGFELFAAGVPRSGLVTPLVKEGQSPLGTVPPKNSHQTWLREPATGLWRLDIFSEPSDDDTWSFRRDERIRLPWQDVIERTSDGIPYGRPEIVLLFKAKRTRPKDDDDFAAALPRLGPERRRWLAAALELVHPGHRWLADLE